MLSAAADAEDQKKARLKAERQAEYNKFLNDKESLWQQQGIRVKTKAVSTLAVPPNLVGHEDYYSADAMGRGGFGPAGQDLGREAKMEQQRRYAQELQEQARLASDRKRQEREQSRAESRELLIQRGELNPDSRQQQGDRGFGQRHLEGYNAPPPGYGYGHRAPGPDHAAEPPDFLHDYRPQHEMGSPEMYPGHRPLDPGQAGAVDFAQQPPRGRSMPEQFSAAHRPRQERLPDGPMGEPDQYVRRNGPGGYRREPERHPVASGPGRASSYNYPPGSYGQEFHAPSAHGADYRPGQHDYQDAGMAGHQAGMVFGDPLGATMKMKTLANQKKAAYREELEQQMRAVADRKAADKRREQEIEEKREKDAMSAGYQIGWGNNRGGGGAPLRDNAGNVISDLNQVRKEANGGPQAGPPPAAAVRMARGDHDHYGVPGGVPAPHQNGPPPSHPSSGPPPQAATVAQPPLGNFRSDHAYMLPQEMEAKARAQRQMQEELQRQIDEKKRVKEEEKRREQEDDRKEMERLAREQDELRAAFAADAQDKKAKAAEEAEELRRMAEEAYIKAKAKKPGNRDSHDGPPYAPVERKRGGVGNSFDNMPVGSGTAAPSASHRVQAPPDHYGTEFSQQEPPRGRLSSRGDPPRHESHTEGSHQRPLSSRGGGRTAAEISKLKEEMSAAQAQMRLAMERQMREVTQRQEDEMRELRRRAEQAEAEVAGIKQVVTSRPTKSPPTFGRRASPPPGEGRRLWGAPEMQLPSHVPAPSYPDAYQDYGDALRNSYGGALPGRAQAHSPSLSIDFGQSLSGESRLIFPGQAAAAAAEDKREVSLSSLRPFPDQSTAARASGRVYPPARGPRGLPGTAEPRQPSRLGTPNQVDSLDVGTVLAKNQDRAKFLDALDNAGDEGGNSDALDDLLTKFVELEKPVPLLAHVPPEHSISLRGESEWIRGGDV